ncbi:Uncharacterised protein [Bordetella pertussis]|nr:Uncharacterised protein [Bordetella pertussis]
MAGIDGCSRISTGRLPILPTRVRSLTTSMRAFLFSAGKVASSE